MKNCTKACIILLFFALAYFAAGVVTGNEALFTDANIFFAAALVTASRWDKK